MSRQEFYAEGRSSSRQEYGYHSEGNIIRAGSRRKQSRKVSTRSRQDTEYSMHENDSELGDFDSDGYGYSCASPEMSSPTRFQGRQGKVRKKSKSDGNIPSSRRKKSYAKAVYVDHRQAEDRRIHQKKMSMKQEQYKYEDPDYYSDGHWIAEEKRRRAERSI